MPSEDLGLPAPDGASETRELVDLGPAAVVVESVEAPAGLDDVGGRREWSPRIGLVRISGGFGYGTNNFAGTHPEGVQLPLKEEPE